MSSLSSDKNHVRILVADDDLDDCEMIRDALKESRVVNQPFFVHDGEELMDYLYHRGKYTDKIQYPLPGLILLDLNMPKKDGREALAHIKNDPHLKQIPVVMLTTSRTEEDVFRTYELGVNSFITKPVAFADLVGIMKELGRYWFEIVALPECKG